VVALAPAFQRCGMFGKPTGGADGHCPIGTLSGTIGVISGIIKPPIMVLCGVPRRSQGGNTAQTERATRPFGHRQPTAVRLRAAHSAPVQSAIADRLRYSDDARSVARQAYLLHAAGKKTTAPGRS